MKITLLQLSLLMISALFAWVGFAYLLEPIPIESLDESFRITSNRTTLSDDGDSPNVSTALRPVDAQALTEANLNLAWDRILDALSGQDATDQRETLNRELPSHEQTSTTPSVELRWSRELQALRELQAPLDLVWSWRRFNGSNGRFCGLNQWLTAEEIARQHDTNIQRYANAQPIPDESPLNETEPLPETRLTESHGLSQNPNAQGLAWSPNLLQISRVEKGSDDRKRYLAIELASGKVLEVGPTEQRRLLATSWYQFLVRLANELEQGSLEVDHRLESRTRFPSTEFGDSLNKEARSYPSVDVKKGG